MVNLRNEDMFNCCSIFVKFVPSKRQIYSKYFNILRMKKRKACCASTLLLERNFRLLEMAPEPESKILFRLK